MLPISLYIHIPFCFKKCPYCSFLSFRYSKNLDINNYIINIINDLKKDFYFKNDSRYIYSIYIGGGTPSILTIKHLDFLIKEIFLNFPCNKNMEITLESNISKLEMDKLFYYPKIGINRLSLGVQSFDNNILKNIGRNYEYKDILVFINRIKDFFYNFSIDLIYGLPGQNINSVISDIYNVIKLNIPHLSWYELSLEKNTFFYKNLSNKYIYFDVEEMYFKGDKILRKNNYFKYEISSYVKKKKYFCLHNINYWLFGDYLGVGCSSHSKITFYKYNICRLIKNFSLKNYLKGFYIKKKFFLCIKDIIAEYFICRLRLLIPLYISDFIFYTGLKFKYIKKKIKLAEEKKYLIFKNKNKKIILTNYGILFLNDCLKIFID